MMDIPFTRWYPAIKKRRSRRHFDANKPIDPNSLATLETVCNEFRPFAHARNRLMNAPAKDIFRGIVGGYGKVSGAPAFVAFIGDMRSPSVHEEVGYTGEGIILEATALGLGSCWVGGYFSRDSVASLVAIEDYERVLAVTPVGYVAGVESTGERLMTGFGFTHRRLPLARLVSGPQAKAMPEWAKSSIEAARLAPSAVNRQPWGFEVENNNIRVFVRAAGPDFNVSKRLDCGIAMLHIEVAALKFGIHGTWRPEGPPGVSRFVTSTR